MEPSGVLTVNKCEGMTSHDVVNRIRRLYGTKKVGHTGTLDPLATGVLVILIGRAAKAAEYLVADSKEYIATLRLGITTDTEDITGSILTQSDAMPTPSEVLNTVSSFVGDIMQTPPMYSALKVNGQKLCDLARQGVEIEREARPITVHSIKCTPTESERDYILDVSCSSGTYIRTLCADIGKALGCGAAMATLCRSRAGDFSLSQTHTLEELEILSTEQRYALLRPIDSLFQTLDEVRLPAFYEKLSRSGCEIYQKKIKSAYPIGQRVRLCTERGEFYALGEVKEYENGTAIKSIKLFDV
ncbi:MAG: tRNA pseudouridine(55) synthase TruB [Clostridia bacterium]|nr:tRNA pseudouridine(55) synthase TruB [Clostridia bacterium]